MFRRVKELSVPSLFFILRKVLPPISMMDKNISIIDIGGNKVAKRSPYENFLINL